MQRREANIDVGTTTRTATCCSSAPRVTDIDSNHSATHASGTSSAYALTTLADLDDEDHHHQQRPWLSQAVPQRQRYSAVDYRLYYDHSATDRLSACDLRRSSNSSTTMMSWDDFATTGDQRCPVYCNDSSVLSPEAWPHNR